ncbi:Fur family transcriptional regulator [Asticcacaulis sp. EMRT-3]|uniref:Fur family transcriptional regulator n=1 Tax=Asticcacaulis sp. EMRT-3 TaxID=3040349 RepID=UPI0024AFD5B0|nr:Fur family transcriptional regulator [Asticcacaulis sp. EMRT-3]MDI7776230.1 Fur family transcriptional regulator [Asticcacaulis sp. EMRT-3]
MSHLCEHTHDHDHDLKPVDKAARLLEAQALCVDSGERMTTSRLRTYELILEASGPIKAYDVIDRFHPDGAAKPPTVYRALSFLEQMGLIHRIESLNAFVACDTRDHAHTAGFLLCECCGSSEEIALPTLADIEASAARNGFQVTRVTLEARGLCRACQTAG